MDDRYIFWYNTENKHALFPSDSQTPINLGRDLPPECSAVICYNDEIAASLINTLRLQQVKVPQQMAVVSFDNSTYSRLAPVPITSLSHGEKNVGYIAAQQLLAQMENGSCQSQFVPWELVEREST